MGSLTMYCRSFDKMGMENPPFEIVALVHPVVVEILSPLAWEWIRDDRASPFAVTLQK